MKVNNTKTIISFREIGGDYFKLIYSRSSNLYLKDFIDKFNFDDYWCFKSTRHQNIVNYEDFLEFKYSGYTFFKKDLYDVNRILEWVEWFKDLGGVQYLGKPTPPFPPQKIIIRK